MISLNTSRTPPNSPQAEQALLSCCLLDGAETLSIAINSGVTAAMFYDKANAFIFSRLVVMLSEAKQIDLSVLAQELILSRQIEEVGGMAYLVAVSNQSASTLSAAYFIDVLRKMYILRQAINEAAMLVEACYAYKGDEVGKVLDQPISRLQAISTGSRTDPEPEWSQVIVEAEKVVDSIIQNKGIPDSMMIPFPWECMNKGFNPFQRGQLAIIAARPSIGKSSLARPIALHAARQGRKVYFITLEVNAVQVALQMAASVSGIGMRKVAHAHEKDQADLKRSLRGLHDLGITISRRDRSISRILARARALHAKGLLDMLILDHGLLVDEVYGAGEKDQRFAIGRLSKGLKNLATDLNIVCVLLWQLNRASAKEANREPNLTDLKDSGSLEEDADKVLFIHRPNKDGITQMDQKETSSVDEQPRFFQNIVQAKGRDDGTDIQSFYFNRATASFAPAARI